MDFLKDFLRLHFKDLNLMPKVKCCMRKTLVCVNLSNQDIKTLLEKIDSNFEETNFTDLALRETRPTGRRSIGQR